MSHGIGAHLIFLNFRAALVMIQTCKLRTVRAQDESLAACRLGCGGLEGHSAAARRRSDAKFGAPHGRRSPRKSRHHLPAAKPDALDLDCHRQTALQAWRSWVYRAAAGWLGRSA